MTTITFETAVLRRLLANASLFACKDDTLPVICSVRFHFDGDHLLVLGTNRYVLSYEDAYAMEADGRDSFSIPVRDVKDIIRLLPNKGISKTAVTYSEASQSVTFDTEDGPKVTYKAQWGEYPKIRHFIDKFTPGQQSGVTLGAEWLGLFAKVDTGRKGIPVMFELPETGNVVRVSMGETFKAVVMAIKHAGT
jgi:DNA polymerase III sliding clamp (beta) subunit (PCNA family)